MTKASPVCVGEIGEERETIQSNHHQFMAESVFQLPRASLRLGARHVTPFIVDFSSWLTSSPQSPLVDLTRLDSSISIIVLRSAAA
jgi:hypothetical protein